MTLFDITVLRQISMVDGLNQFFFLVNHGKCSCCRGKPPWLIPCFPFNSAKIRDITIFQPKIQVFSPNSHGKTQFFLPLLRLRPGGPGSVALQRGKQGAELLFVAEDVAPTSGAGRWAPVVVLPTRVLAQMQLLEAGPIGDL